MMLRNTDVPSVMDRVSSALSKLERDPDSRPLVMSPDGDDELGIAALRKPARIDIEFLSGSARPVIGRAVRLAKRATRRGLRWYMGPVAEQQTRFNLAMLDLAGRLHAATERLETKLAAIEQSLHTERTLTERDQDRLRADFEQVAGRAGVASSNADLLPSVRDQLAYRAFEDRHRGDPDQIRDLLSIYIPYLQGRRRVVDVGCGRGELIALLNEHGIDAYGIEPDSTMAAAARERGVEVVEVDAVTHLRSLEPGAVDAIVSTQVIEHLEVHELMTFLDLAYRKLAPGGLIVLETPNPESLFIFHSFFYVDLTHTKPIHPEALSWALESMGFTDVRAERILACPEDVRLTQIPEDLIDKAKVWHTLATNIVRLNALLYGPQHYAGIGVKPAQESTNE